MSNSRYDSQSMRQTEYTIPTEKKTLESFRMKLLERKKLKKLKEMKKKRD